MRRGNKVISGKEVTELSLQPIHNEVLDISTSYKPPMLESREFRLLLPITIKRKQTLIECFLYVLLYISSNFTKQIIDSLQFGESSPSVKPRAASSHSPHYTTPVKSPVAGLRRSLRASSEGNIKIASSLRYSIGEFERLAMSNAKDAYETHYNGLQVKLMSSLLVG